MPTHLPPDEMLADFARGASTPGVSLLMAAHLTQAPESREKLREFERIGGVLLAETEPEAMPAGALDATLALLSEVPDAVAPPRRRHGSGPLPQPILDQLGVDFDDVSWKFRLPGVSVHDFDGFGDEKVSLLRARPGSTVPQHTHKGTELTLVLQGCLLDNGIEYRRGDLAVNDECDDHQPKIIGDEICYCLIVQHGDLHFTGTFSRFLNYLGE